MNTLFQMPDDGWFQISAIGDFPHATTGLVQVIDGDAVSAIVQKFTEESAKPNFPGVLVDWDHASLDLDKPTEAAGWIVALQQRPDGLWGQIRWSDRGAEAVQGGRYRFMSPVWRQEDCLELGEKKVRPLRLFNCALTNDPNIRGMVPLANSARPLSREQEKAIFAKRGGGSESAPGEWIQSSTGWELNPALKTSPEQAAQAAAEQGRNPALAALQQMKDQLESYRKPRPESPPDRRVLDPKAVRDEMLRRGRSLNEATDAERAAEAHNRRVREERQAFDRALRSSGYDQDQRDKAWSKKLEQEQKAFDRELAAWQTREARITKEQAKLDVQIGKEEAAQERRDASAQTAGEKEAARVREKEVREQVSRDKESARRLRQEQLQVARENRALEQEREKNDPQRVYRAQLTKRRTYWDALARGDRPYAERIYPGANHQKNAESMKTVSGWKDKVARLRDTEPQ